MVGSGGKGVELLTDESRIQNQHITISQRSPRALQGSRGREAEFTLHR